MYKTVAHRSTYVLSLLLHTFYLKDNRDVRLSSVNLPESFQPSLIHTWTAPPLAARASSAGAYNAVDESDWVLTGRLLTDLTDLTSQLALLLTLLCQFVVS